MEKIIKYLSNPLQTGVYYGLFTADFSLLGKFIKDVAAATATMYESEAIDLVEIADSFKDVYHLSNLERIKKNLGRAMNLFFRLKVCPSEITKYVTGYHRAIERAERAENKSAKASPTNLFALYPPHITEGYLKTRRNGTIPFGIFESHILYDIQDVMFIETEETTRRNLLSFEITTIKAKGLLKFYNFLTRIPYIGSTVKELQKRKTHSSRYVFRPYPFAIRLWLSHEKTLSTKKDLKDFIRGSIRYHSEKEWRTSIILSAITVESILADLYEERYKEYAPSVPLGDLYHKVKEKIDFPAKVREAIEMVNKTRISAVHRSRFPVSDRDATNALYGATTLVFWYSTNF